MKIGLSPSLVRNSLSGHAWLGLLTGFLMYLICVSGSLVVFAPQLKRWEQPTAAEFESLSPAAAERAYRELLESSPDVSGDILMMLPREQLPRASLVSRAGVWALNEDGSRGGAVASPWTNLMVGLHDALHLPSNIGLVVVSAVGALLCGLIVSGFLAHPRIFRDAFNFRLGGSRHLEQADIHNRLSVWGAPFHLVIAVTGAWFGMATLMYTLFGNSFFDGDREAAIQAIHGRAPELEQQVAPVDVKRALEQMRTIAPDARPIYFNIEGANSPRQYLLLGAQHDDRLIYVEQYRFDQQGNYLGNVGYTDGEPGQRAIFSTYRLHFGHFGGLPVMVLYGIFGLALAVVSVSGINIWLARRRKRDAINLLWSGLVWGTPLAVAVSAATTVLTGTAAVSGFWMPLLCAAGLARWLGDEGRSKAWLQGLTAVALAALALAHMAVHKTAALAGVPLAVNTVALLSAVLFLWLARRSGSRQSRDCRAGLALHR